jgi:ubiquinone/menaquinone biosynthesis C-methylase UbiE
MVAVLGFSQAEIRAAVTDMYTLVADKPDTPLHFPVGREACRLAGYSDQQVASLPDAALESFAGVGCPFRADIIQPGQTVLDVGSGSGTDVIIAARAVGPEGKVFALDMTAAMRQKLQATLQRSGIDNVEVIAGDAEQIPLPDASVDVVSSNGVLNLVPDKRRAIREIFRVLKADGQVQIADIVIASPVTPDCEDDPKLWAECVVGATVDESYLEMFRDAGFDEVEVLRDYDYFAHSPSAETREIAGQFGAHAYELRMRRRAEAPALTLQWARRFDPRRLARNAQRRGLWGMISLLLALIACYGTLALLGLMSALGVSLALNEGIWAGTIVLFAWLACAVIAAGIGKHRSVKPLGIAVVGAGILSYSMFVNYQIVVELAGFISLAVAAGYDYHLRRWSAVRAHARQAGGNRQAADMHSAT